MENEAEKPVEAPKRKMRQIIIETDGNDIHIVKSEVAGKIEFMAIMRILADKAITG